MLADGLMKHMDTADLRSAMSGSTISMQFTFHAKNKTGVKAIQETCEHSTSLVDTAYGMET